MIQEKQVKVLSHSTTLCPTFEPIFKQKNIWRPTVLDFKKMLNFPSVVKKNIYIASVSNYFLVPPNKSTERVKKGNLICRSKMMYS